MVLPLAAATPARPTTLCLPGITRAGAFFCKSGAVRESNMAVVAPVTRD